MAEIDLVFYPPGTAGSINEGYYHHLNDDQKEALLSVQEWVVKQKIDMARLSCYSLHPTLVLLRYLRANGFDSAAAIAHMKSNIDWRIENKVDELVSYQYISLFGNRIQTAPK